MQLNKKISVENSTSDKMFDWAFGQSGTYFVLKLFVAFLILCTNAVPNWVTYILIVEGVLVFIIGTVIVIGVLEGNRHNNVIGVMLLCGALLLIVEWVIICMIVVSLYRYLLKVSRKK